jgi:predicted transcriptional regulator
MSIPQIDGTLLKQLRKNRGLTQLGLAKKVGVTQGYIAQIEKEKADPKLSLVNKILETLLKDGDKAVSAKDIMTRKGDMLFGEPNQITMDLTEKMLTKGYSQVPILNKQKYCIGTLIESDLLVKTMKRGPSLKSEPIKNVMAPPLPSFHENTSIDLIEKILEDIPAILITGDKGKITGIITRSDILKEFPY